jgi:hypothetical protein
MNYARVCLGLPCVLSAAQLSQKGFRKCEVGVEGVWQADRWLTGSGRASSLDETRNTCNKPYGKKPLGRQTCRWNDCIRTLSSEVARGDVNWTEFRVLGFLCCHGDEFYRLITARNSFDTLISHICSVKSPYHGIYRRPTYENDGKNRKCCAFYVFYLLITVTTVCRCGCSSCSPDKSK